MSTEMVSCGGLSVAEAQQIADASSEELRGMLASSLAATARELLRMAAVVRTLEERGEDLSDLKLGMIDYLRRIAHGQVLPEVVVRFAEHPMLVRQISALPLPEQRRLAVGEPVTLIVRRDAGQFDQRQVDPLELTGPQIHQVFARGSLRSPAQQIVSLEDRPRRRPKASSQSACRADRERGGIVVGRKFVPLADALSAIAESRGTPVEPTDEAESMATMMLRLPESDHQRLKIRAAQSRCTMIDLVRRALYAAGLIATTTDTEE